MSIDVVCVIGAGTMGHGIAQVAAMAGCTVRLYDVSEDAVAAGLKKVAANLEKGVKRGKVEASVAEATLQRLSGETDAAKAGAGADLVVEAVPERIELKRTIFSEFGKWSEGALFATNTSSIPLSKVIDVLPDPTRFCGLHFFNPVHIQPLLEIVKAERTSDAVIDTVVAFAKRIGKEPIVVKDSPGFASSRLGLALGLEAIRMLEEGVASAADIDAAMTLGYRHPMGPLKLTDLVGLDVRLNIAQTLAREIDPVRFAPPKLLIDLVAAGKLGRKSGAGFYEYDK